MKTQKKRDWFVLKQRTKNIIWFQFSSFFFFL